MRIGAVLCILSVGLLAAKPAVAGKTQGKERAAKKACLSGDYVKGISILAELYVGTDDANFLYNQGRCYEQNLRYLEAAERFKEYLRKAVNLTDQDKADVDRHIAECEAAAAKAQGHGTASASQPSPLAPEATPSAHAPLAPSPPAGALTPALVAPAQFMTPTSQEFGWQHTAKWVAAGAAVAFLGFGVVEHITYYGKNRDYNNNPTCPNGTPSTCSSLANSADTAQTLAIVGYGAAAVATGAAIVFWLTDSPRPRAVQQARFNCVPALAGVLCQGSF